MSKNIFEGAKFGDVFKTRDGRKALYHSYITVYPDNPYESHHKLILEEEDYCGLWIFANDYGHTFEHIEGEWFNEKPSDIIGLWNETKSEEELDYNDDQKQSEEPTYECSIGNRGYCDDEYLCGCAGCRHWVKKC